MFYNPRHIAELPGESIRIWNLFEPAIKNVVILVAQVRIPLRCPAHCHRRAQRLNLLHHHGLRELDHFHSQREPSQHRNSLARVRHHHKLLRRRGHNFFPQQRPATTFNQAQLRINFIRSIHSDIDLWKFIQRDDGNPQARCLLARTHGSWDSPDTKPLPYGIAQQLNEVCRCRSRPQADDLAIPHKLHARPCRRLFFLIVGHKCVFAAWDVDRAWFAPVLPQTFLHVNQIPRQHQPKQHRENRHQIHDKPRGLKLPLIQLRSRLSIAQQSRYHHHESGENRTHPHPHRKPRRLRNLPLELSQLPQSDRKAPNRESEYDNRYARPHPCQKRAFVGQMVAGPVGILNHSVSLSQRTITAALFHSLRQHHARASNILDQVLRHAVPLLQIFGTIV